jgi:penicillin amidase
MALQCDVFSTPAQRVLPLLSELHEPVEALAMLRAWDCHLHVDSAAGALFEVWWTKHLKPALLDQVTLDPVARPLLAPGDNEALLATLEAGGHDALLAETLAGAYADCQTRFGPRLSHWQWGALHHGYFPHPLSRVADPAVFRDVGRLPTGGSGSSPMATAYRGTDFRLTVGASFRVVMDVGDWDRSRVVNTPGQSGNPLSPHYDDLAPLWARGEYVPLLYSRAAVDEAAELRIILTPG